MLKNRHMHTHKQDMEQDDDEEEDEEDEEEEKEDETDSLTGLEGLSLPCQAMLKQALIAQVGGELERAVHLYLMCFKVHPAAAPNFRDEFMQVLTLHGSRLAAQGEAAKGLPLYKLAAAVLPRDAEALTLLGRLLFVLGKEGEARQQWLAAIKAASTEAACVEARESLDLQNARAVNRWHYRMINDAERNQSYEDALRRAVERRGSHATPVLDIGAGTGLLAMYAARCSSNDPVWACEMSEPMVEIAAEVLAANKLSARVSLLAKHSDDLRVAPRHSDDLRAALALGGDSMCLDEKTLSVGVLRERVQVIVTETADCGLLGESMMPSLRIAAHNLLATDGQTMPCNAQVHALLVHSPILRSQGRVNEKALRYDLCV